MMAKTRNNSKISPKTNALCKNELPFSKNDEKGHLLPEFFKAPLHDSPTKNSHAIDLSADRWSCQLCV